MVVVEVSGTSRGCDLAGATMVPVRARPGPILRWVLRFPRALYRWRLGWLLGRRFLLLEHVGRTTGSRYQTVLEVIAYHRSTGAAVVMSGWGRTSDWYRNIEVAGHATVTLGRKTMKADARVLDDEDAVRALANYERRNRWIRPVVRRVLSQLAGFRYDGTDDGRLALVRQLPVVKFTPAPGKNDP
jgi:deazaflavin-dependent oxidoreductase (nitroreductase family)